MKHGKKFNHLGRKAAHRNAMLSNMASSLIMHKRIETTTAKAKALRKYVEPLITKSKDDTTHSRRIVFKYLQDKNAVTELFREVAPKIAERPGGYTRIIKTGFRLGDNADMCFIELVDYNDLLVKEASPKKKKRRRRGSGSGSSSGASTQAKEKATTTEQKQDETVKEDVEAKAEVEAPQVDEVATEEQPQEKAEAKEEAEPKAEEAKEEAPKAEAKAEQESEATEEESTKEEEKKEEDSDNSEEEKKD